MTKVRPGTKHEGPDSEPGPGLSHEPSPKPSSKATSVSADGFSCFADFYPYYLTQHSDRRCRALHYIGSGLVLVVLAYAMSNAHWQSLWLAPLLSYGCAWLGHYGFEGNRPATFRYPLYSFLADWLMLKDFLCNRLPKSHQ